MTTKRRWRRRRRPAGENCGKFALKVGPIIDLLLGHVLSSSFFLRSLLLQYFTVLLLFVLAVIRGSCSGTRWLDKFTCVFEFILRAFTSTRCNGMRTVDEFVDVNGQFIIGLFCSVAVLRPMRPMSLMHLEIQKITTEHFELFTYWAFWKTFSVKRSWVNTLARSLAIVVITNGSNVPRGTFIMIEYT